MGPRSIEVSETVALTDLVGRLGGDLRDFAQAEVQLYKAKATQRALAGAWGVAFVVGALFIALATLVALFVGLIGVLSTLMHPGWATLIVVAVGFALTGLLAWLGLKKFKAMTGGEAAT